MKKIFINLLLVALAVGFVACDPQEDKDIDLGSVVPKENIKIEIKADEAISNLYHFSILTPKSLGIFECDEANIDHVGSDFAQQILWAGNYTLNVRLYNKAGISDTQTFNFSVAQNDPKMYQDTTLMNLTGGDAGKKWIVDSTAPGHLGVGPTVSRTPDWWSAGPGELNDKNFYDDEMSFVFSSSFTYILNTNGKIFVNESAAQLMAPDKYPTGSPTAIIADYVQPKDQKWKLITEGNTKYIQFQGNGFPAYVANPSAVGGKYEVTKLTKTELHLRWAGDGICWYYKFKAK